MLHRTDNILLSFVLPVYNVEKYLNACLESILAQDLDAWEAILVDDGSTDGSGKICDVWAAQNEHFIALHQENGGISSARNLGFRAAKGSFVMFVDSDDFLIPHSIHRPLDIAIHDNLDMIEFDRIAADDSSDWSDVNVPPTSDCRPEVHRGIDFIGKNNYGSEVWHYIFGRDFLIKNHLTFPVGHMIEDAGYVMRAFIGAERVAKLPEAYYCYRIHTASIMHNANKEHQLNLISDYLFAAKDIDSIIKERQEELPELTLERCTTRRNSYVFMGMIRALRLGAVDGFMAQAKAKGLFPFSPLSKRDYPGVMYAMLHRLMHIPWLWKLLSRVYGLFHK